MDFVPSIRILLVLKLQKVLFVMTFIHNQSRIFEQLEPWFLLSMSPSKACYWWRTIWLNNWNFRSSHHSPVFGKIRRNFDKIGLCRYSNSYFSVTTRKISSTKVSIKKFFLQRRKQFKSFCFDTCIRLLTVQILQKVLRFFISLVIQALISHLLQVHFLPFRTQSKTYDLWTSIQLESHCFSVFHQNPDKPNIPEEFYSNS